MPGLFALEFSPAALRSLRKLDQQMAKRIRVATESLRTDPRPQGIVTVVSMPAGPAGRIPGGESSVPGVRMPA